jgi:triacylglycerol lipase
MKNLSSRMWAACAAGIFSTEQLTTEVASNLPRPARNRALLVHGIADSAASMRFLQRRLARDGRDTLAISLKAGDGSVSLEEMSLQLRNYVGEHFSRAEQFDLIGFSMGGLVCRYYVQMLGGSRRVDRLVTISTPNHGTLLAFLNGRVACKQMRPSSEFLQRLNGDCSALRDINVISFWTPWDLVILPAHSSRMPVGMNKKIPVLAHPLMILQTRPLDEIAKVLSESPGRASDLKERLFPSG